VLVRVDAVEVVTGSVSVNVNVWLPIVCVVVRVVNRVVFVPVWVVCVGVVEVVVVVVSGGFGPVPNAVHVR
jgi:hypothetical protein